MPFFATARSRSVVWNESPRCAGRCVFPSPPHARAERGSRRRRPHRRCDSRASGRSGNFRETAWRGEGADAGSFPGAAPFKSGFALPGSLKRKRHGPSCVEWHGIFLLFESSFRSFSDCQRLVCFSSAYFGLSVVWGVVGSWKAVLKSLRNWVDYGKIQQCPFSDRGLLQMFLVL